MATKTDFLSTFTFYYLLNYIPCCVAVLYLLFSFFSLAFVLRLLNIFLLCIFLTLFFSFPYLWDGFRYPLSFIYIRVGWLSVIGIIGLGELVKKKSTIRGGGGGDGWPVFFSPPLQSILILLLFYFFYLQGR